MIDKNTVKDLIKDLVADLLYYDRKDDEEVEVGDIDKAVKSGVITIEEMADEFLSELRERVNVDEEDRS